MRKHGPQYVPVSSPPLHPHPPPPSSPLPPYREIFPEGLPPSYVFVATLRLHGAAGRQQLDLWRVLSKDGETQAAVTLDGRDKTVTFTTTSTSHLEQTVTFTAPGFEVEERTCVGVRA